MTRKQNNSKQPVQVNSAFDKEQIAWIDQIALKHFCMVSRGARTHVVRVCVNLVREQGLLGKTNDINIPKPQSAAG